MKKRAKKAKHSKKAKHTKRRKPAKRKHSKKKFHKTAPIVITIFDDASVDPSQQEVHMKKGKGSIDWVQISGADFAVDFAEAKPFSKKHYDQSGHKTDSPKHYGDFKYSIVCNGIHNDPNVIID